MDDPVFSEIHQSRNGSVAVLQLARPDLRNAFTTAQSAALQQALDDLTGDDAIKVIVLTGTGRYFNVGGSRAAAVSDTSAWDRSMDSHRRQYLSAVQLIRQLHRTPKVTIAAVNGGCAGAGLALALAADLRYAASTARFNTAFLSNDNPGELGAIWFATRLVGTAKARELFLLPDKIDAEAAARLGLVNGTARADQLMSHVFGVAERIAAANPQAIRSMKANLNDASAPGFDDYLDRETERMLALQWSAPTTMRRSVSTMDAH